MQSPSMQVDVAVSLLNRIEKDLQSYRAAGFVTAQMSAKDICEEMNVCVCQGVVRPGRKSAPKGMKEEADHTSPAQEKSRS